FVQIQEGVTFDPFKHPCGCKRSPYLTGFFFNLAIWLATLFMLFCLVLYLLNFFFGVTPLPVFGIFFIIPIWGFAIIYAVVYLIYLIEVFCTYACKYLHDMDPLDDFVGYIEKIKQVDPYIGFWCECYHYVTKHRTVSYTDSSGNRRTRQESYQEKVVTHRES